MTKFDYSQKPWWLFAYEATMEALEDSGTKISEIDAILLSAISSAAGGEHQTHKLSLLSDLFKTSVPILEMPAVCAGGGVAFWTGYQLLKSNFKNILVVSGEKVVDNVSSVTVDWILSATMDDLALISFKNHHNANLNPKAYYYKRPVSLEKIKKSPIVASPFRMFDCSLSVNGGAAAIISKEKTDIEIAGAGFATDYLLTFGRKDTTHFLATKLAAEKAYQEARISPKDIDIAEVHDAFTSVELFSYEDLNLAPLGKGAELIRTGKVSLDGELPVNPSGGLKAKGHPISVTGLAQVYEIVNQLRGRCGERQVKSKGRNPKIGLCHNIGGAGGSCTCHILKKVS